MDNHFEKSNPSIFMRAVIFLSLLGSLICKTGHGQNYHAIEGSPYAGSMGVSNNPASIVNTPLKWDLTLFSAQVKNSTNAATFYNFSLLSHGDTANYKFNNGNYKRFAAFNANIHLLNARIAIGRKQAISFGLNFRSYGLAQAGKFNYNDSVQNMNQFFNINNTTAYNAHMVSSSWFELYATYARTLFDNERGRLNAGITLKGTRGVSGEMAQLNGGSVQRHASGDLTYYLLNAGSARYGYSSNFDRWHNTNSTMENLKNIIGNSRPGASMDFGVEYLIKSQAITFVTDGDTYNEYEWKIGVSLLDVGQNSYKYGTQSRAASSPKSNVADSTLNIKFDNTGSLAQFNDSLATIVNNISTLTGIFKIWNPTRLVINVDRPLGDRWSVNGNLSLNITGSNTGKRYFAQDFTLLSLTPRWETKNLGAYLPVQVTYQGKVWVGGAFKAGPLLFGIHNWANLFAKDKMQNGGLYLAIVIHPGLGFAAKENKQYSCPKY
jgi:hypothetical protein